MITREKERIFKRFMNGESIIDIWNNTNYRVIMDIENAIRDVAKARATRDKTKDYL